MKKYLQLRSAATLLAGLTKHATLPMTHVPVTAIAGALAAVRRLRREFAKARVATRRARRLRNEAVGAAQAHALTCRQVFVPFLGPEWTPDWIPLGWEQPTLSIPEPPEALAELYQSLSAHLTDHAELCNPPHKVTVVDCQQHRDALEALITGVVSARCAQRDAREARNKADATLAETGRRAVKELELILAADDPRWIDFVQEVPADVERPEPITELVVEPGAPGELEADWGPGARAERYLVYVKVLGEDTEFRRLATVQDEAATLTGLPPGKQVAVRVVAANSVGESAPSDEAKAQVPALAKAA